MTIWYMDKKDDIKIKHMIPNTTFITRLFWDTVHGIITFNIKALQLKKCNSYICFA